MTRQATLDPQLLLISPEDNCLIVRRALPAGARVQLEDGSAVIAAPLGLGHKLARHAMPAGEKILKYGAIIGSLWIGLRGSDRATPIPFGPYLAAAGWVQLMWGPQLLQAYRDFSGLN